MEVLLIPLSSIADRSVISVVLAESKYFPVRAQNSDVHNLHFR